jgi:hypothetical protein
MTASVLVKSRLGFALLVAVLAGAALAAPAAASTSHAASGRGILPPGDPSQSLSSAPGFLASCAQGTDTAGCNSLAVAEIDHARQVLEKLGGMSFSLAAYEKLSPDEQLFVITDLERTERGLAPATVLSASLDRIAQAGARADTDPALGEVPRILPGGGRPAYLGAIWAGGLVNALGSDYAWMYDDGPGGNNLFCRTAGSAGCWGHRNIILTSFGPASCRGGQAELAIGAGHVIGTEGESDAEVLAGVCGPAPTDAVFTWARAQKLLGLG